MNFNYEILNQKSDINNSWTTIAGDFKLNLGSTFHYITRNNEKQFRSTQRKHMSEIINLKKTVKSRQGKVKIHNSLFNKIV